jgi:allantoinase
MLPRHDRYPYSYLEDRQDYCWPGDKRLAFYIATNLEDFAFGSGSRVAQYETLAPRDYAGRDYGMRVGIAYLMDMFDELGIRVGHNINSLLYEQRSRVFDRVRARKDEVIGHGRTNSERQDQMSEADEAHMIRTVTDTIRQHEGVAPKGWLGPGRSESKSTPDLLQEAGYKYLMDWACDDQPIWMKTRSGRILSVPYPLEINDGEMIMRRRHSGREFADMIVDHFEEMLKQSAKWPLVYGVSLHPFMTGHPFQLRPLRQALLHCVRHPQREQVWYTVPGDICEYCYALPAGIVPGS